MRVERRERVECVCERERETERARRKIETSGGDEGREGRKNWRAHPILYSLKKLATVTTRKRE